MQRHQSPERLILHQISSRIHPKIQRRQVIMNVLHPGCARPPRCSPPVLWRRFTDGLVVRARCPKKVRRRDLMMDESCGWLVMRRMSAFLTKSCQRMSRIFRRHRWSTASIRCISTLLIAQHSDPQSIIGSMKTLYRGVWSCFIQPRKV